MKGNLGKAKGRREFRHLATAVETKGLWRATCWWKVSWVEEAKNLHGLLVEWILAVGFGNTHILPSRGDRDTRVMVLSFSVMVNSHTDKERQPGEVRWLA
jgi:hypothetical protein